MHLVLLLLYGSVLLFLCSYGVHRALLSLQCVWHKKRLERAMTANALPAELPRVTVQLPLYNEATVARRLIEAAGLLDYPKDKLELQILDDSNDETVTIARAAVKKLREEGIDAVYVRRPNRVGYKAGALDHGLSLAKGELIA